MKAYHIINKMNEYLHTAAVDLSNWLYDMLPQVCENWWEECVVSCLSFGQRERVTSSNISALAELDLSALLRVADKNWYNMRNFIYLPTSKRETLREMFGVRNNWAHLATQIPSKDIILRDVDIVERFLTQFDFSNNVLLDIHNTKEIIKNEVLVPVSTSEALLLTLQKVEVETTQSTISDKSVVCLITNKNSKGIVIKVNKADNGLSYDVFIDGEIKTYFEGQICLDDNNDNDLITAEMLRCFLTSYQITHPSVSNLYSLNSARIEFVPYQFRPALKVIKADVPRLLIADSVGVGKTIETGLILKELSARYDIDKVLIVCPKPLVAERKWELEMKRFDEDFTHLDGGMLKQIISECHRDGEWPSKYNKSIIPYSILDKELLYGQEGTKKKRNFGLVDLDPAPHFDLLIVDEAHHIRNSETQRYAAVKYLCDNSDAVIFLTATPLQTGSDDLYTLLNTLRPDIILDKQTFNTMLKPNKYISSALHFVRTATENWNKLAYDQLKEVETTDWGMGFISSNPAYLDVLNTLSRSEISREQRVELIANIESLNSFSALINRTRRQDIQDFCVRRSHTVESSLTDYQKALHDELINFEATALGALHGDRFIRFMTSTIRRQASSCVFGLAPFIRNLVPKRLKDVYDDPDVDLNTTNEESAIGKIQSLANNLLKLADNLPNEDGKFDSIVKIIEQKQLLPNNKIIIFSSFKHTLRYLKNKLNELGYRVAQIDGDVADEERLEFRAKFELSKEDVTAINILLFTEVGCEGLDYQFCDMLINYDLPWNPMRIEQRIGRIDRRGQKSDVVNIYNMITSDTIDADVYYRCLSRIGVFEESIGDCADILGQLSRGIETIMMSSDLTEDERRFKLAQIADNEVRQIREMRKLEEEEKQLFGVDLSEFATAKEVSDAENSWLSSSAVNHIIKSYLEDIVGDGNYITGESSIKLLRLPSDSRRKLLLDLRKLDCKKTSVYRIWETYLKGTNPNCHFTFEAECAEKNRNVLFLTALHPFTIQAAKHFESNNKGIVNLCVRNTEFPVGVYHFSIYAWNYVGTKTQYELFSVNDGKIQHRDLMELLQYAETSEDNFSNDKYDWSLLEKSHYNWWKKAKEDYQSETELSTRYKLESLTNSYRNRKRIIENQIISANDENIVKMKKRELENITAQYDEKILLLGENLKNNDIHISLLISGTIIVEG